MTDLLRHADLIISLLAATGLSTLSASVEDADHTDSKPIATALQPFLDSGSLAGAVTLVADRDSVLSLEATGCADIAGGRPMRANTLFWIASQTKPITAAALMMLVDEGRLSLHDSVETYLPEFKTQWLAVEQDDDHMLLKRPNHPITVRNILNHTSGMPFASAMEQPTLDMLPLKDAVRSYAMTPLRFEPDSRYEYSNAGINTAGRLIEVISDMSYEEFLQRRLLAPLGMKDTTFRPDRRQIARLAKSYKPDAAGSGLEETTITQLSYPLTARERQPMPAGGLFSTASDVARFCQLILNDGVFEGKRYLSADAVRQMTSKQTSEEIAAGYGLGWATDGSVFGHGGAMSTGMEIDAKRGLITIFLVQHAGFPGNGNMSQSAFKQAALTRFGNASR